MGQGAFERLRQNGGLGGHNLIRPSPSPFTGKEDHPTGETEGGRCEGLAPSVGNADTFPARGEGDTHITFTLSADSFTSVPKAR